MRANEVIKGFCPPYALSAYRALKNTISPPPPPPSIEQQLQEGPLFDGADELFKKLLLQSEFYGEYGCGKSTIWAARNSHAKVFSVDTSQEWISRVTTILDRPDHSVVVEWVDVGPLGDWGYPTTYTDRHNFSLYTDSIWRHPQGKPDTVLIDGRFRVACFLLSLVRSEPGTKIIFDDYTNRARYHLAEEFVNVSETFGRQALFVVPKQIDKEKVLRELKQFEYVLE